MTYLSSGIYLQSPSASSFSHSYWPCEAYVLIRVGKLLASEPLFPPLPSGVRVGEMFVPQVRIRLGVIRVYRVKHECSTRFVGGKGVIFISIRGRKSYAWCCFLWMGGINAFEREGLEKCFIKMVLKDSTRKRAICKCCLIHSRGLNAYMDRPFKR